MSNDLKILHTYTHAHTHAHTRYTIWQQVLKDKQLSYSSDNFDLNYHEISFSHKNEKQLKNMIIPSVGKELKQLEC